MEIDRNYIVCGRGQRNYNNDGNKVARHVVATRLAEYMDESSERYDKTKLVDTTTRWLLEMNMVFVKRSDDDRHWVKLCDATARSKVGHLFRDASRQARRCKGRKAASSTARVTPASSDSDDAPSVASSHSLEDETNALNLSDALLREEFMSCSITAAMVARPCNTPSSQKIQVAQASDSVDNLGPDVSMLVGLPADAMDSAFIKDELLLHAIACTSFARTCLMHSLDALVWENALDAVYMGDHTAGSHWRKSSLFEASDTGSLSDMEHLDHDLFKLLAECEDFAVE